MMELSPVIPVEQLTRPLDRFFCEPWKATLSAAACTARQRTAREQGPTSRYDKCFDCPIGKQIVEQLGAPAPADLVKPCAQEGCRAGAVDGDYCAMHARSRRIYRKDPPKMAPKTETPAKSEYLKTTAELARLGKRTEGAVYMSKALQAAKSDGLYDVRHPAVAAWLRGERATTQAPNKERTKTAKPAPKKRRSKASPFASSGEGRKRGSHVPPSRKSNGAPDVRGELQRASEALDLVEAIGWELVRDLAERVQAGA